MTESLSLEERKRRVIIVCCSFGRNHSIYVTGWKEGVPRWPPGFAWREINSSVLDKCVLEWCILFGDEKGSHFWKRVIEETEWVEFEKRLLEYLGVTAEAFQELVKAFRDYRDKFVAHLDDLPTMQIPRLTKALAAVQFLHAYLVEKANHGIDLRGLPSTRAQFELGYQQCLNEFEAIFAPHAVPVNPGR